jgi:uncharacterized membrane protein
MTTNNTGRNTPDRMDMSFGRQPIHPILVSFSAPCFVGAFVTDLAYWQTADVLWETFSDWLLTAGMIMAGLAVGYALAVLLSLANAFVHSRDGYTAVVPTGLTLSALVVVILLFTAWVDRAPASRRRAGVST